MFVKTGMRENIFVILDASVKKGKPAKKADTGKKVPKKKAEAAKKPPKSKANEVYQPDQYYSSPPPAALAGEQSVSRGLFIQTITEVDNFILCCFRTAAHSYPKLLFVEQPLSVFCSLLYCSCFCSLSKKVGSIQKVGAHAFMGSPRV